MYLKSLELFGFKSFPGKTLLKFEPGITVVVGPNGCGKSNIFDSIKWALGEQSPKSLRGSKMEDVIFSGTEHHPPLNYTEVVLTFSNEDGYLPIDYKEVAVGRKLYRSGESEYYLNKNLVRLKDIDDLFLGTGIGESTYSFIEQGKIEIFLSYKPEEKRLIFDEASGIIKYKERKKETLKKLQDTEQNLLRLEDIISEVSRQIRYLERQVEKAKRYKEIESSLIEIEERIATIQVKNLEDKVNLLLEELNALKQEEQRNELALSSIKNELGKINHRLQAIRDKLQDINSQGISSTSKIELYQNNIAINSQRIEERELRNKLIGDELIDLEERLSSQTQRLDEEKKLVASLDREVGALTDEIESIKESQRQAREEIVDLNLKVEDKKKEILATEGKRLNINNELVEVGAYLKNLFARKKRLLLDKEKLDDLCRERKEAILKATQRGKALDSKYLQLSKQKQEIEREILAHIQAQERLQKTKIEREKQLVELRSWYEFLKDLRVKYASFSTTQKVKVLFEHLPTKVNKLIASFEDINFSQIQDGDQSFYVAEVEAKVILFKEEKLQEKIGQISTQIKTLTLDFEKEQDKKRELKDKLKELNNEILVLEKKQQEILVEKDNLNQEFLRVRDEIELLEAELNQNSKDIEEIQGKKNLLENDLEEIEHLLTDIKNSLQDTQKMIASLNQQVQSAEIQITKSQTKLVSLEESRNVIKKRINMFEEDRIDILKNIERLKSEEKDGLAKISSLKEEIESLEEKIRKERANIEQLTQKREVLKENEEKIKDDQAALSKKMSDLENNLQETRACIYDKKLKLQELEYQKGKIFDYLKQVYNIEFTLKEATEGENLDQLQDIRDRLKKKLDSLGEVNLVALDEFDELNKRFQFLQEQKADLIKSKDELKKAIQKINRISRQIFLETFSKIKEEFKKNFRFLFGGGEARLILLDEQNVLESGVEIEVQPPGKKLQNVSLLSGGEKALTAIALIFAIFKVSPSPLCVLDEIDAPLDEANVDRFNHLLKEFSQNSQFIIITHNKKTMESADVLYGVTMEEKGISKIVSVKFAEQAPT
jgi:chromosome segregation protein